MDENALSLVEQAVASFPDGVRIAELENHLIPTGWKLTRRSLLRYLQALISNDRIWAAGSYRAPVYHPHLKTEEDEIFLAISPVDRALREKQAGPVPFRRDLLLSYTQRGNSLDDEIREHLHRIGASGEPANSAGTSRTPETFLIDLSWASSCLEGNSYSLLEAEKLLTFGEVVDGKEWLDAQMILNHREAIEFLTEGADEIAYNSFSIRNLHAILSDNLLRDPEAHGRLRQVSPVDHSSRVPLSTPQLLEEYFERTLEAVASIADPFEQAFFTLVYLIYLQPFDHFNGAVARLAANIPLLANNLCPISFIDISNQDFAEAARQICEGNSEAAMRRLFVQGYERSVTRYVAARVELQQPDVFRMGIGRS